MKRIQSLLLFAGLAALLAGCEKFDNEAILAEGSMPAIAASSNTIVLTEATALDTVVTFTWNPADFGFKAAASYTIQVDKAGNSFAGAREVTTGNATSLKYSGAELNQLALILGLPAGSAGQLEARVKTVLTDSLTELSAPVSITVTPYTVIINYPSIWVPGEYQGWTPATADKLSSKLSNGVYEGYVNLATATVFKYTSHADWDHVIYGYASGTETGDNVAGTFNTSGGNLYVPSTGYYLLKGNTNDNSWSATKILSWGMIGDFNNWTGDEPLTYDPATKLWTGTFTAAANGIFKIRANGAWAINLGDTGGDLGLDYDGADIPVTAGTHTVTMNLSIPGNYSFKIQ